VTETQAEQFLLARRADPDGPTGWMIAHEIGGELEWFSVIESDGAVLDRVARRLGTARGTT